MKIWNRPEAIAQQFAANEYVSACYNITCVTPNDNDWIKALYDDSNGNGVYDEGTDQALITWKGRVSRESFDILPFVLLQIQKCLFQQRMLIFLSAVLMYILTANQVYKFYEFLSLHHI